MPLVYLCDLFNFLYRKRRVAFYLYTNTKYRTKIEIRDLKSFSSLVEQLL